MLIISIEQERTCADMSWHEVCTAGSGRGGRHPGDRQGSVSSAMYVFLFFFSSRRRHTRYWRDWSSDVCSSDLGGIIVIDFIDMARARNRTAVLETLRASLDEDRTKTFVVEISPLGLVEMTRQNVTDGVREIMTKPCPTCDGEGVVKSEETIAIEVERKLRDLVAGAGDGGAEAYLVRLNPKVTACFTSDGARMLDALETDTGRFFHFEGSDGLALDHFSITLEGRREEVLQQAVPFSEGDEVHVTLVEPHM